MRVSRMAASNVSELSVKTLQTNEKHYHEACREEIVLLTSRHTPCNKIVCITSSVCREMLAVLLASTLVSRA